MSATTTSQPQSQSSKPPVSLQPTTHLDPGAYVRGTHPITIGANTLIHPRSHLLSIHAPLTIGDNCIIPEKAILGGPLPSSTTSNSTSANPSDTNPSLDPPTHSSTPTPSDIGAAKPCTISSSVSIAPHAIISHSTTISTSVLIESNVTIQPYVTVGAHSKLCAGITVSSDVPEWTVVSGNGSTRRKRLTGNDDQILEKGRLRAMDREREATMAILKQANRNVGAGASSGGSSKRMSQVVK